MIPEIIKEEDFLQKILPLKARLDAKKISGTVCAKDGMPLYYEFFEADGATATVIVVHGLSEFTRKFYELADYLLSMGLNVMLYDQRGHGMSGRLTDDVRLIHVGKFCDYTDDLALIHDKARALSERPVYLYGHSMGGAVCILYLARQNNTVKKAVLTAPMIRPHTGGTPAFLARALLAAMRAFGKSCRRFAYSKDFNPEHKFRHTSDASYNRFRHNLDTRIENERYQSTPMTVGWVAESLAVKGKCLRAAKRITTPILMLSPENDTVVSRKPQFDFARLCDSCEIETVGGAKHSILTGTDGTIREHIERLAQFYCED